MNYFLVLLATLFYFAHTEKIWAWGDLGHQTVAEIAEQIISQDEAVKKGIQGIMGVEPFAMSSTWPDHVRSDGRFDDFAPYHYITVFQNPKQQVEKDAWTILKKYPDVLLSDKYPRESKMIAFRYLVHVVGDIHQPLHVGHEYDRGGNNCQVSWQPDPKTAPVKVNLHAAWDTNLIDQLSLIYKKLEPDVKYYGYKQLSRALMNKYKTVVDGSEKLDIQAWVKESEELRKTHVYPDQFPDNNRPYCKAKWDEISPKDVPVLGESYFNEARLVAEKQMVLGGVRLAVLLKEIFKNSSNKEPIESEILQLLKLSNDVH